MLIVDDAAVLYYFFTLIVTSRSLHIGCLLPNMKIRKTIRKINDVAKNTKIAHCAIIAHM